MNSELETLHQQLKDEPLYHKRKTLERKIALLEKQQKQKPKPNVPPQLPLL